MDGCKINIFVNESLLLTVVAGYQAKLSLNTDRPVQLLFFLIYLLRHCSKNKILWQGIYVFNISFTLYRLQTWSKKRVFRFFWSSLLAVAARDGTAQQQREHHNNTPDAPRFFLYALFRLCHFKTTCPSFDEDSELLLMCVLQCIRETEKGLKLEFE